METAAQLSGLSYETVRGYENGRRSPTRESLLKLLAVLRMTAAAANAVVEGAGFAAEQTLYPPHEFPQYYYHVDELQRVINHRPWPSLATNDAMYVIAANRALQALWGIDYAKEKRRRSGDQLSLFTIGGDYRFIDRVANWPEIISIIASVNKGRPQRTVLTAMALGVVAAMQATAGGDEALLKRLLKIWQRAKPAPARVQWDFPLQWRDPEFGELRFRVMVSVASEPDMLSFQDWHPVDADTWQVMDKVMARETGAAPKKR
jgi:transcriptional regulator with XRE-family HTH domain